ncbi:MAG TPA: right-handed parallel beta-helix repeat-containing protein [Actinomycetota bacterium]|jgi:polygalacturonase|nr:right-handed parallel beta-helix repeat-containing protein [Actinomycetota bacterium]
MERALQPSPPETDSHGLTRRDFLRAAAATGVVMAASRTKWAWGQTDPSVVTINAPQDGRDATGIIQAQIDAAPDGSTIVFPPGRYRCEGSIKVENRTGLKFRGPATFYATQKGPLDAQGNSQRRHWWFIGCTDVTVDDLRVVSTNTRPDQREGFGAYLANYEFEHGFAIHECLGVVVRNCSTFGTWGDGLYIGNQAPSRNVRVSGLVVEWNGRQGLAVSNADGVLLENIQIRNTRRAGFDLEPATALWSVRNVEIRNSFTNGYHVAFASAGNGDVSNIYIHHNRIKGPGVPWVYVRASDGTRRRNWRIHDNRVLNYLGSPMPALFFSKVDNVSVRRNKSPIVATQSRLAIRFESCRGRLVVRRNDFRKGVRLYRRAGNTTRVRARKNRLSRR